MLPMTSTQLGRMIRKLREQQALTQEQLATRAKLGQAYISKLERGGSKNLSVAVLARLAKALGVSPAVLLG